MQPFDLEQAVGPELTESFRRVGTILFALPLSFGLLIWMTLSLPRDPGEALGIALGQALSAGILIVFWVIGGLAACSVLLFFLVSGLALCFHRDPE